MKNDQVLYRLAKKNTKAASSGKHQQVWLYILCMQQSEYDIFLLVCLIS